MTEAAEGPAPASDYDEFVDWPKRLAREAPLFRRTFDALGARRVIDVGAGSARHAIMFATWGLDVAAVDPDESMLAQAERNVAAQQDEIDAAGGSIRLVRGGFGDLASAGLGPADCLTCTGNALPHVQGLEGLRAALADFAEVLRPGGGLVLHLLNHARLLSARPRTIAPVFRSTAEGDKVFLRVIDYPPGGDQSEVVVRNGGADRGNGASLGFDFITLVRDSEGEWTLSHRRSSHTALPAALLVRELAAAGFEQVELFGSHEGTPYDAAASESVILVARRSG